MKCCFCKANISGEGNNAEPVKDGICCDRCNMDIVVPMRILYAKVDRGIEYALSAGDKS